jgi:hypothetical protein
MLESHIVREREMNHKKCWKKPIEYHPGEFPWGSFPDLQMSLGVRFDRSERRQRITIDNNERDYG